MVAEWREIHLVLTMLYHLDRRSRLVPDRFLER